MSLTSSIKPGLVNAPGQTPDSQQLLETLLDKDRLTYHCFSRSTGLHNHLSHHLLAAHDLGAPAKVLRAIYDKDVKMQRPIDLPDEKKEVHVIDQSNWTQFLADQKQYKSYVNFFASELTGSDVKTVMEKWIFSPAANGNGAEMFARFVGGAFHPFIQTGYAAEFGGDAMFAQALAQAAMSGPLVPEMFDSSKREQTNQTESLPLLQIIHKYYESPTLTPVMPYDNDALLSARIRDARKGGRPEEIRGLSAQWVNEQDVQDPQKLARKIEEMFWVATLVLTSSGKVGREPRLDFFLMHVLNATIFLPSIMNVIPTAESKAKMMRAFLSVALMFMIVRGRPRINAELIMAHTDMAHPPLGGAPLPHPHLDSVGGSKSNDTDSGFVNPWPQIHASVIHATDVHTVKAIRSLYYAAQHYGNSPAGSLSGATITSTTNLTDVLASQSEEQVEVLQGIAKVDGSIFVRAAGLVMKKMGWVTHGEQGGSWDSSALGWDDAWKDGR